MEHSTIAAISTPVGSGGIGIIRISGPQSISIANSIFIRPPSCKKVKEGGDSEISGRIEDRRLCYGYLVDPDTRGIVDEVLLVRMFAPRTYTGEDVVEIQSHSNPVAIQKILQIVLSAGARIAEPGEFTRRAFMNGRIDLAQAEAVADVINAKSSLSLKIANTQLRGGVTRWIEDMREAIVGVIAQLEAGIDFSDDMKADPSQGDNVREAILAVCQRVDSALVTFDFGRIVKDGLHLGIAGRPNVGKSSLLNRLLNRDRAIVTPQPGTTRDLIEEYFTIQGIPIYIADMAGIHETDDPVERIGIEKAKAVLTRADIVLFLTSAVEPAHPDDARIHSMLPSRNVIDVINKCDLTEGGVEGVAHGEHPESRIYISALTGYGLEKLKQKIVEVAIGECTISSGETMVTNIRQKECLERCRESLLRATTAIDRKESDEFVCADLNDATGHLSSLLGGTENPDVLDAIFSRFCIGK